MYICTYAFVCVDMFVGGSNDEAETAQQLTAALLQVRELQMGNAALLLALGNEQRRAKSEVVCVCLCVRVNVGSTWMYLLMGTCIVYICECLFKYTI